MPNPEFIKEIFKNKTNQFRFKHAFYENDDHRSVRLIGEYDALRFIFDYYKLKIYNGELINPDFKLKATNEKYIKSRRDSNGSTGHLFFNYS